MNNLLKSELCRFIPPILINQLFEKHSSLKEKFIKGYFDPSNLEVSELNAGKFGEIVIRILQHLTTGQYAAIGRKINFDNVLMQQFEAAQTVPESIRIHIPRTLRAIYDIRNRRGVGHVSVEVSPNLMDASFLVSASDWIVGELIRLYSDNSKNAKEIIDSVIKRDIPILWTLDGNPLILDPKMNQQNQLMVFLYQEGDKGGSLDKIKILFNRKSNQIPGIITQLVKKCYISKSPKTKNYVLTPLGIAFVQKNISLNTQIN